jgi:RNA recognition motif-containing protein
MTAVDPLTLPDAPKLNDDFSNYFVVNNLPKCEEEKIPKLVQLIETSLTKSNLHLAQTDIEIPINPETQKTDGVAFVRMKNEDMARIGVSIFDGFVFAKKKLASCLLPEFDKIMQTSDEF